MAGKCFLERVPDDSVYTLWTKNVIEVTLSHTVSKINTFLHFMQTFKMVAKIEGQTIFGKKCQITSIYSMGKKFCRNRTVSEINAFLHFSQKFKMAAKISGKILSGKKWHMTVYTLWVKNYIKITLSRMLSKINAFFCFTQKLKMATKNFWQKVTMTLRIP